jgi:transposase
MKKNYDNKFKAMVALEAVRGEKTLAQISSEYGVHPNVIANWKKKLLKELPVIFSSNKEKRESNIEKEQDNLYKEIGKLKVENEFLKKKFKQIFG